MVKKVLVVKKIVKLSSVINLLKSEAEKANMEATGSVGIDDGADAYFQGLRNGYLQAAKLLEQKSDQLV